MIAYAKFNGFLNVGYIFFFHPITQQKDTTQNTQHKNIYTNLCFKQAVVLKLMINLYDI